MNHREPRKLLVGMLAGMFILTGCSDSESGSRPTPTVLPTQVLFPTLAYVPTPLTPLPAPPMPTIQVGSAHFVFQVTDLSGRETTISAWDIKTDDKVLTFLANDDPFFAAKSFPLRTAGNVTVLIPYKTFRRAYQREGKHVVTIANGQELEGLLDATLPEYDGYGREFDLRTAQSIVLLSMPQWTETELLEPETTSLWTLHISEPGATPYTVSNPRFAFIYSTTEGMLLGEKEVGQLTTSFYFDDGIHRLGENPSGFADLMNYAEIVLRPLNYYAAEIRAKTSSGVEMVGTLDGYGEDSRGKHMTRYVFLVANIPESAIVIALYPPGCTLTRIDG
jgi:hypothetical protein